MQTYWSDFTVLMQKACSYGGLVVVHDEPDFCGCMYHQSSDPTSLPAVVASSGNPDLTGLSNTVAGIGLVCLKLRNNFFFQAVDGIRAADVTGVQTCALPISRSRLAERLSHVSTRAWLITIAALVGFGLLIYWLWPSKKAAAEEAADVVVSVRVAKAERGDRKSVV